MAKRAPSAERPKWSEGLTDSEFAFVAEYLIDHNGTQAALRSKICDHERSARQRAYELIHTAHVSLAIDKAMVEAAPHMRTWLTSRLANIARGNIAELVHWDEAGNLIFKASAELPPELQSLVKKISRTKDGDLRLELHDPMRAIETLAKVGTIGLTKETVTLDGKVDLESLVMAAKKKIEAKSDEGEKS
jgi:hypothetical protein